ncbi:bisanhydrobacterioruberin hydratase [Halolamina sediminis]|uniref:bisanhydrobacterioruberin hydratase n=1 Tax=Halolamina sediminis TaxID=1480675 RepID=UPI0006B4DE5D|nr:bisanhydrobacterioruberin hydratase [Halolamina sediminis]
MSVAAWLPDDPADRRSWEAALSELIREHRFTIAVVFPAVGAVSLIASAEGWLPEPLVFNPLFVLAGVIVMRSPLIVGVLPVVDRRAALGVAALAAYSYAIEIVGVTTGWPYGQFEYGVSLGPMLGGVPVALPVFFLPLVANAYLLCLLLLGRLADRALPRLLSVIALVLAMDVVLDPGAVALGFWTYGGGVFYGVPLSNYAGWVLSATVAVVVFDATFDRTALGARLEACEFALDDMVSFVLLWGGVNAVYGNWLPVLVAAVIGTGLLRTDRFDAGMVPGLGRRR